IERPASAGASDTTWTGCVGGCGAAPVLGVGTVAALVATALVAESGRGEGLTAAGCRVVAIRAVVPPSPVRVCVVFSIPPRLTIASDVPATASTVTAAARRQLTHRRRAAGRLETAATIRPTS